MLALARESTCGVSGVTMSKSSPACGAVHCADRRARLYPVWLRRLVKDFKTSNRKINLAEISRGLRSDRARAQRI